MSVLSCPTVLREASLEKQEKMAITNFDGAPKWRKIPLAAAVVMAAERDKKNA